MLKLYEYKRGSMKQFNHLHGGHRQRLKDKVRSFGLSALSEHEVLELVLTYSIPYRDTNELAHRLIDRFGSIAGVLDSDRKLLKQVAGVGEETALFLSILPQLFAIYKLGKGASKVSYLRNVRNCIDYFRQNFEISAKEVFYIICLDRTYKVIDKHILDSENITKITIDIKRLTEILINPSVSSLVLFHTHPNGTPNPSIDDLETTQAIFNLCEMLNVGFCDHIIFNETDSYSLGQHGYIAQMANNFSTNFKKDKKNLSVLRQAEMFKYTDDE